MSIFNSVSEKRNIQNPSKSKSLALEYASPTNGVRITCSHNMKVMYWGGGEVDTHGICLYAPFAGDGGLLAGTWSGNSIKQYPHQEG